MTKVIPLEDHVLVKATEQEQTTKSGLIVQTKEKEKPSTGEVIAVGSGKILDDGSR